MYCIFFYLVNELRPNDVWKLVVIWCLKLKIIKLKVTNVLVVAVNDFKCRLSVK